MKQIVLLVMFSILTGCASGWKQDKLNQSFNDDSKSTAKNFMEMFHRYFRVDDKISKQPLISKTNRSGTYAAASLGAISDMSSIASMVTGAGLFGGATLLLPVGGGPEKSDSLFLLIPASKIHDKEDADIELATLYREAVFNAIENHVKDVEKDFYGTTKATTKRSASEYFMLYVHGLPEYEIEPRLNTSPLHCYESCEVRIYNGQVQSNGPYKRSSFPKAIAEKLDDDEYYIVEHNGFYQGHPILRAPNFLKFIKDFSALHYAPGFYLDRKDFNTYKQIPVLTTEDTAYFFIKPQPAQSAELN